MAPKNPPNPYRSKFCSPAGYPQAPSRGYPPPLGCPLVVAYSGRFQPAGLVVAVCLLWHGVHSPRPYWGLLGLSPRLSSSLRSSGWWSATLAIAMLHRTQMGSRVSTACRKRACPVLAYGLPLGLRCCSAVPLHVGQRPDPWCSSGHSGLVHTRHGLGTDPPARLEVEFPVVGCG